MQKLLSAITVLLFTTTASATNPIYKDFFESVAPNKIDYFGFPLTIANIDDMEEEHPGLGYSIQYAENPNDIYQGCRVTSYIYDENYISFTKDDKGNITYHTEKQNTQPITKEILPYTISKLTSMLKYFYKDISDFKYRAPEGEFLFVATGKTKETEESVLITLYDGHFFKVRTTCQKTDRKEKVEADILGLYVLIHLTTELDKFMNQQFPNNKQATRLGR